MNRQMTETRTLSHIDTPPPPAPGFIGEGHTAVEVVRPDALASSDPFVLLMDDRLLIPTRRQIGGPHPHAGLETVTLVLEGTLVDRDEGGVTAGDVIWMTAGRGIIHNEAVEAEGRARILQLWIALPPGDRLLPPRFQIVRRDDAPVVRAPGVQARLYSGSSGSVRSSTDNRVPVTMIDVALAAGATFRQDLPVAFNGFMYVVDGSIHVGDTAVAMGQVGWLTTSAATSTASSSSTAVEILAGERGARVVLYAGRPIRQHLVQQGPFVAGSPAEIIDFHRRYRAGQFTTMSEVARTQRAERQPS